MGFDIVASVVKYFATENATGEVLADDEGGHTLWVLASHDFYGVTDCNTKGDEHFSGDNNAALRV